MSTIARFDVLIIGSGAAGMSLALQLPTSLKVAVLSKTQLGSGSTFWAQGGMAAVLHDRDTVQAHVDDTLSAGAGLCHEPAVQFTVGRSRQIVDWLISQGMNFDLREDQQDAEFREFHLTMEGGHSHRRVVHAADQTGRALSEVLATRAAEAPNITMLTDRCLVDVFKAGSRVCGAYLLSTGDNTVETVSAGAVVLATGGASKAYRYTTNPDGASGDGIAVAWRAGCRVANMEFNQFHPTCLYHPESRSFLMTEALRGEGATLHLPNGQRFMSDFDDREELAPRDIVARAIDHEMKRLGADCIFLDISHQPAELITRHFPQAYERCLELGIDITHDQIPVVPAAHYTCGGVVVDQYGASDVPGLYVVGESACTGLHGANRMASNSLLECFVYAQSAAQHIAESITGELTPPKTWDDSRVRDSDEEVVIQHNWQELRRLMWDYVGIVRTSRRLEHAADRIALLEKEVLGYYGRFQITRPLLEMRNLARVSSLMVQCAAERRESRGLHYTSDFPDTASVARDSILIPAHFDPDTALNGPIDRLPHYHQ
ncbi:MAG: L-aspartate oxidase [Halieaceae bacterium]|nr:L-aspartate oxidase [Halieaceae bacterium]